MRIILLALLLSLPLRAQDSIARWSISGGMAIGSIGSGAVSGTGGILTLAHDSPHGLFSLRTAGMGGIAFHSDHVPSAYDVGVMYGVVVNSPTSVFSASTGLSLVMTRLLIAENFRHRPAIGIPFELQLAFPASGLGIGFSIYGNVNPDAVFYGAGMVVRFE